MFAEMISSDSAPVVQTPAVLAVGDPTIFGWFIVVCYFATVVLCGWVLRVSWIGAKMAAEYAGEDRRSRDRKTAYRASFFFWVILIVLFAFLGLNKQIDLQTWLTDVGRRLAQAQGWYAQRGKVQAIFVGLVAIGGLATLAVLLSLTRELLPRHVLAFVGLVFLACFVLVRTSSFHEVERVLRWDLLGIRLSWLLELSGIICVGLSALMNCWWYKLPLPTKPRELAASAP
ncbi:MAG: hypothetical protein ACYS0G_13075 [Planctomycetota bacterium]|jgi:hypothetical protein